MPDRVHAGHDPLRVAEAADRGGRLAPVLDLCARCVGLYGDLVAVTAALPMSARARCVRARTRSPPTTRVAFGRSAGEGGGRPWVPRATP